MITHQTLSDNSNARRANGFSLVEISIVLVIIAILATVVAGPAVVQIKQRRATETQAKLAVIEGALALFAAQNYRLPCPALGTVDATDPAPLVAAASGIERVDSTTTPTACTLTNQQHGVIPWKALGLSVSEVTDGWGNIFTYRVDASMIRLQSLNLTFCSPGGSPTTAATGTAPHLRCDTLCSAATFTTNCTTPATVTVGRGLKVQDISVTPLANPAASPSTGVAYVVISHGENGIGSYTATGSFNSSGSPAVGTEEAKNRADVAYVAATSYLVENTPNFGEGTNHFDDFVLRRTILSVATKAQLGPRAY